MRLPSPRTDLVVDAAGDQLVVLDPATGTAQLLGGDAVLAWQACRAGEDWRPELEAGLQQLAAVGLVDLPPSRRRVLRSAAVVGGAAVVTLALPVLSAAASGTGGGGGGTGTTYDLYTIAQTYNGSQSGPFTFFQATPNEVGLAGSTLAANYHVFSPGVTGFTGYETDRSPDDIPVFVTNTTSAQYSTTPPQSFIFHPGPSSDALVRFQPPGGGAVTFTASGVFSDVDAGGGNGVRVALYAVDASDVPLSTTPQTFVAINTTSTSFSISGSLPAGGSVIAQVNNAGDYSYDTTKLSLSVTVS